MNFEPTPRQALLLFGLLARFGECSQSDLMPEVKKADREALTRAKLVKVHKIGRSFVLTLEDTGWEWASSHLSAELPPSHRALADMLARLADHLKRSKETLADFIGRKPAVEPAPKPRRKQEKKPIRPRARPRALTPAALRKKIETAYLAITGGRKNETVSLTRLRNQLAELDRAVVDAGLGRILADDDKALLMRNDDPRRLSQADHDAAFSPFGEPFHMIWIAS